MTDGGFDLGALLQKARSMQANMQEAQEKAAAIRVEGKAGGGMVVAVANGRGQIMRLTIEQSLLDTGDKEMLEDLTAAAVNQAYKLAKEALKAEMSKATGGLPMPFDLDGLV